jgi:NAD+-dependent secondary alcohol dehydrogenase Adh1
MQRPRRRRALMKAVRLHKYHERPSVDEVAEPTVKDPLDVLVRVGAAGLCRTDLHIYEGQWEHLTHPELPFTLGHENAGWVEEVGSAVSHVSVGDTVILHPHVTCGLCHSCRAGDDMHCVNSKFPGVDGTDGGMADYLLTGARSVVKLDPSLQPADVAALADAGLTAYHAVKKAVPLLYPGTTALVIGAGGLGHIGVQTLKALTPTTIIVLDRNQAALDLVSGYGADYTVLANDSSAEEVLELTDGHGADVVFDFVAEQGAESLGWNLTRRAGSHYVIGYGGTVNVPAIDIISSERNIVGNLVGSYNDLAELMVLAAQGKVELHTRTYPLDAVNTAMDDLDAGRLQGRGILVPG